MTQIGERIKLWRKENHVSQQALAEKTGFSVRSLQSWEKGTAQPSLDGVICLALAMGVTSDWLLGIEDQRRS